MGALRTPRPKEATGRAVAPECLELGLVLLDSSSLRPIAVDPGATAILASEERMGSGPSIPQSVQDAIRGCPPNDLPALKLHFRTASGEYNCRAYPMAGQFGSTSRPVMALHLERAPSGPDSLDELSEAYRLTDREREALRGIAMGLASKELAERMKISPNTVKAFLRLIMIKLGVTTRAGIAAKLLEHNRTRSAPTQADGSAR